MKISKNNYYCITLIIFIAVIILVILYSDNIINVVNENFDIPDGEMEHDDRNRDDNSYRLYDNEDKHVDAENIIHKFQNPSIYIRDDWYDPKTKKPTIPEDCLHIDVLKNNPSLQGKWGDQADEFVKFTKEQPSKINPCTRCGEGTFLDTYKRTCTACPPGTFSDKPNSLECKKCGLEETTTTEGQTKCITEDDYDLSVEEMEDTGEILRAYNNLKDKYKNLNTDYLEEVNRKPAPNICETVTDQHEKQLSRVQEIKETNERIKNLRRQVDDYMNTLEDVKSIDNNEIENYYPDSSQ